MNRRPSIPTIRRITEFYSPNWADSKECHSASTLLNSCEAFINARAFRDRLLLEACRPIIIEDLIRSPVATPIRRRPTLDEGNVSTPVAVANSGSVCVTAE